MAPSALGIGGSTWSYHSDEFDDIISDASGDERAGAHAAPAHDAGALRDNGKDPASDDDADQMPLLVNSFEYLIRHFFLLKVFLIGGGLYSVTALRKITMRVTVYTKHQLTLQKP